ncbi:phosphonate metabolism transcriptional regulator PhnF [Desulfonatronum thioautotrophicum]|uniref:phosphonate metabolism transcriptional regulator PhnF n=1 Tax=Desulfonatronum thioautotrophicum TaxID=617001 RepID=UPI0005EB4CA4|nr:phosphonate metabolism transcriptional regulator PhnF [Desulfonatronum thioautotrophicum]
MSSALEHGTGVPLWRQIHRTLTAEIEQQRYPSASKLPTEHDLAKRFHVNRHTVRRALAELESQGLVTIEQGRGAFVTSRTVRYHLEKRVRFTQNLHKQNIAPQGRLLEASVISAEEDVRGALRLPQEAKVNRLVILRGADKLPLNICTSYFSHDRFPNLISTYKSVTSVTKALHACGLDDFLRQSTRLTARMPTAHEARLLQQPRSKPVMVSEVINTDLHGVPVELGIARWAAERVEFFVQQEIG